MNGRFTPRVARKYIGTYRAKVDGWEKATGRAQYEDDITIQKRFPAILYAKVMRSPTLMRGSSDSTCGVRKSCLE